LPGEEIIQWFHPPPPAELRSAVAPSDSVSAAARAARLPGSVVSPGLSVAANRPKSTAREVRRAADDGANVARRPEVPRVERAGGQAASYEAPRRPLERFRRNEFDPTNSRVGT
jgi:hypothetical protein